MSVTGLFPKRPRLAAALLDRLAHKVHTFEFVGKCYRFRQRMQQETQQMNDR